MGPEKRKRWLSAVVSVALAALAGACASVDPNIAMTEAPVLAIPVGEAAEVSAADLAQAMVRAGFSREEILKHGPAVRNSLATSGGAQVRDGKVIGALFSIHAGQLYVTSRTRGTFVQPLGVHAPR